MYTGKNICKQFSWKLNHVFFFMPKKDTHTHLQNIVGGILILKLNQDY